MDVFINRMVSQCACLNHAAALAADMPGLVHELCLGNGRIYHHIVETMPTRDIYVFERAVASPPDSTPPEDEVMLGDVYDTLPAAFERFGATASLIHADLGGHNLVKNDAFALAISLVIEPMLAKDGLMVASDKMYFDGLVEIDLAPEAVPGRCFI